MTRAPSPAVVALDDAARDAEAGPKARNLARLKQGGVPVPDGFVVTAGAWRSFMQEAGLAAFVPEVMRGIGRGTSLERLHEVAATIARAHERALPKGLERVVLEAYVALGRGPVAVRSSATDEDQRAHSAAGVFHTALDVGGEAALLAAIRSCWASLYCEAALAYRLDRGLEPASGAMAVVVQRMVRPDAAGVLFTRSPVGGDRDAILVEAVPGRGRELVDGEANPERYEIARERGEEARIVSDGVPRRILSEDALSALSRAARRVEELLGPAVDVEWALCEGRLEILQARPITTRASLAAAPKGAVRWTAANTQEALLEPVQALTWSLLSPLVERGRSDLFRAAGFKEIEGAGYMRLFYGRPYFNPDYFRRWLRQVPGAPENIFDALIFGEGKVEVHFRTFEFDRKTFRSIGLLLASRFAARERFELFLSFFERRISSLAALDLAQASDQALLDLRRQGTDLAEKALRKHVLGTAIAGASYLLLDLLLKKTGTEPALGEGLVARLTAGTRGNILVQANARLHDLARLARSEPALGAALFEDPPSGLAARVERLRTKPARTFLDGWRRFLDDHGHRAEQEAELAAPRWVEDPSPVVSVLRSYVASEAFEPPRDREQRLAGAARELAQRVARALHRSSTFERLVPAKTGLFWLLYREARRYAPYRENLKAEALRALFFVKRVFLETGRRLVARGLLDEPASVFHLEVAEVEAALRGEAAARSLRDLVTRRRAEHERDLGTAPPAFVLEDASGSFHPLEADKKEGALEGVAVSQGVVTGTARVLRSLEDAPRVKRGDVIVARVVNGAWTPLFVLAGGIVAEMGGVLSHGAIVAREYGIPCVFGVTGATARIKDGDRLVVDGDRGVVRVEGS